MTVLVFERNDSVGGCRGEVESPSCGCCFDAVTFGCDPGHSVVAYAVEIDFKKFFDMFA